MICEYSFTDRTLLDCFEADESENTTMLEPAVDRELAKILIKSHQNTPFLVGH